MQNGPAPSYSEEYIGNITFMHTQNILVTDHIQFNFICRPQKHINHTINLLKVDTCKQIQLWPMAYLTYCPVCLMVRFTVKVSHRKGRALPLHLPNSTVPDASAEETE